MSRISRHSRNNPRSLSGWGILVPFLIGSVVIVGSVIVPTPADAAEAPVGLGTAAAFSVLAHSTVTNTGPSLLSADVGVSPGSAVTGFPPGIILGTTQVANGVASTAKADALVAFNDADGRVLPAAVPNDLVGLTLLAGLHASPGPMSLSGEVTLDGGGDPDAVFIFQSPSTLITGSDALVTLTNGAQACNIVWQVDSSVTLGTDTAFQGTILAAASITLTTGATLQGRAHALNGAVTLDTNTITSGDCEIEPPIPSGSATVTTPPPATATTTLTSPGATGLTSAPGPVPGAPTSPGSGGEGTPSATTPVSPEDSTSGPTGESTTNTAPTTPVGGTGFDGSDIGLRTGSGGGNGSAQSGRLLSATGAGQLGVPLAVGALVLLMGMAFIRFSATRRH